MKASPVKSVVHSSQAQTLPLLDASASTALFPFLQHVGKLNLSTVSTDWAHVTCAIESPKSPNGGLAEMTAAAFRRFSNQSNIAVAISVTPLRAEHGMADWMLFRKHGGGHLLESGHGRKPNGIKLHRVGAEHYRRSQETPLTLREFAQEFFGRPMLISADFTCEAGHHNKVASQGARKLFSRRHDTNDLTFEGVKKEAKHAQYAKSFDSFFKILKSYANPAALKNTVILFSNMGDLSFAHEEVGNGFQFGLSLKSEKDVLAYVNHLERQQAAPMNGGSLLDSTMHHNGHTHNGHSAIKPNLVTINIDLLKTMVGDAPQKNNLPAYKRLPDLETFLRVCDAGLLVWGIRSQEELALCKRFGLTPVLRDEGLLPNI